jgi:hypothetical protein
VKNFRRELKREDPEDFNSIDPSLTSRYLGTDEQEFNYFGCVKPSERDGALLTVANDIFTLINLFQSNSLVSMMP